MKPTLTPDPKNANKGTPRGRALLEDSLRRYGAGRSILVDKHGTVIAGNKTLEAAVDIGLEQPLVVPSDGRRLVVVQRTDLDLDADVAAKELALADNRIAQVSLDWDVDALNTLAAEGVDLTKLWTDEELATLLRQPKAGLTDPDAVPEVRATDIQPGDLFGLGDHRLLCGDSTKAEDVARVMGGDTVELCLTDPPYNVGREYVGDKTGDDKANYRDWSVLWFGLAQTHANNVAFSCGHPNVVMWAGIQPWKWIICWYKPAAMLGSPFGVSNWEPVLFFGTTKSRGRDVVEAPIIVRKELNDHPVPKPVDFGVQLVKLLSDAGDKIYDPFSGSGTTLIACEQLRRRCYAIEIEPQYVQVAIDRWQAFTGRTAVKVGSR